MKDKIKGNFIIFQNVIYPEESRQIFLQEIFFIFIFKFYIVMKIYSLVPRPNFGRRYGKVI